MAYSKIQAKIGKTLFEHTLDQLTDSQISGRVTIIAVSVSKRRKILHITNDMEDFYNYMRT